MNKIFVVFRNELTLFLADKGMLIFYFTASLLMGGGIALLTKDMATCISFTGFLTITFLIPLLADSLAGEREKRTLESILSTAIKGSSIVWRKFLLSIVFALVFFTLTTGIAIFTKLLMEVEIGFTGLHWIGIGLLAMMTFTSIILSGLYQSALSSDTQRAYTKIFFIAFPLGVLYMTALTTITSIESHFAVYVIGLFFVFPPLGIVYLTNNHLLWSIVYCIILGVVNMIYLAKISNRISRPQLLNWIQ